jgi:hypothetical protein
MSKSAPVPLWRDGGLAGGMSVKFQTQKVSHDSGIDLKFELCYLILSVARRI